MVTKSSIFVFYGMKCEINGFNSVYTLYCFKHIFMSVE